MTSSVFKAMLKVAGSCILMLTLFLTYACESKEEKAKKSFNKAVSEYIKSSEESIKKDCTYFPGAVLSTGDYGMKMMAYWWKGSLHYKADYEYNIEKSDSIVSPYLGAATVYSRRLFLQTEDEGSCKSGSPKEDTRTELKEVLQMAYQDGKWVIKDRALFKNLDNEGWRASSYDKWYE